MSQELIHFDAARKAIQKAASVDEAKGIRDKAEALRVYAKQSGRSLEMQNRCAEIKLRAERRAGEILSEMEKNPGARGKGVRSYHHTALKLADLGISKVQSHRWQKIAGIPEKEFEAFLTKRKTEVKELTSVSLLRLAKEMERQAKRKSDTVDWGLPLQSFAGKKVFSTLVVDVPWDRSAGGDADQGPPAMSFEQIADLPVPEMCAKDSHRYLWVTNKNMAKGFELVERWGFRYVTCLTWCKPSLGARNYFRSSTEHILFCVRGSLELARDDVGTWFQWPWGKIHSEKPDRFYEFVMSCSPGPYAVLFSAKQREGWRCFGGETENGSRSHNSPLILRSPRVEGHHVFPTHFLPNLGRKLSEIR